MTFEVQQTRWDRIIRRVSGSIGPGSRVGETLSELFPVLDVERVPGELLILGGTRLAWGGATRAGVAAEFAKCQLFNPAGSENIITITRFIASHSNLGGLLWGTVQGALSTDLPVASRLRDTREVFPVQPVGLLRIQTDLAAPMDAIGSIRILANTPFTLEDVNGIAILAPGERFSVGTDQVAHLLTCTFFWRERPAEQSELQF